jgi:hypothetical protein
MNTANLQLEGLYLAVAAITNALVAKGVLSRDEVAAALRQAEAAALTGDRMDDDVSPANREAVAFPARILALANAMASEGELPSFAELARMVGEMKDDRHQGAV